MNEQNLTQLRELLVREFNEDELTSLCRDVGLNYADLPGMGPYGKTREMITAAQEKKVIESLMARVRELRPDAYNTAKLPEVEGEMPVQGTAAGATDPLAQVTPGIESPASELDEPVIVGRDFSKRGLTEKPRPSALSLRTRLIGFIIVVLLLAVAVLTIVLPHNGANPNATPASGTDATMATLTPAGADTQATVVLTPAIEAAVATETSAPTAPVSETHAAAQAVLAINDLQMNYYLGKADASSIQPDYSAGALKIITKWAATLKTKLGVDVGGANPPVVAMHYVKNPTLISDSGNTAKVLSREYWSYANGKTNKTLCDTSDYTYTMTKSGDKYIVSDIKSKSISSKCE